MGVKQSKVFFLPLIFRKFALAPVNWPQLFLILNPIMHPEALTNEGKGVFSRLSQFEVFYLAGGTGLALQLGHRVSVDFDLFNPDYILPAVLLKTKRFFEGFSLSPIVNNPDELSVLINGIKLTFLRYPFPVL